MTAKRKLLVEVKKQTRTLFNERDRSDRINRLSLQADIADLLEDIGLNADVAADLMMSAFESGRRHGRAQLKAEISKMAAW